MAKVKLAPLHDDARVSVEQGVIADGAWRPETARTELAYQLDAAIAPGWYRIAAIYADPGPLGQIVFSTASQSSRRLIAPLKANDPNRSVALVRLPHPIDVVGFQPGSAEPIADLQIEIAPLTKFDLARHAASRLLGILRKDPKNAIDYIKRGLSLIRGRTFLSLRGGTQIDEVSYDDWLDQYDYDPSDPSQSAIVDTALSALKANTGAPAFSIVMPTYNTREDVLRRALDTVVGQVYDNWELCIADDASPDPTVRQVLTEYAARDPRIKIQFRDTNGHISEASNSALALCNEDWVVLMDHDDEMHPLALLFLAQAVVDTPSVRVLFSDEDKVDEAGRRFFPYLKGGWNRDLFFGHNLMTHTIAYRRADIHAVGGWRSRYDGSQDYDLALRILDRVRDDEIVHIPHVLYHWRTVAGSVALSAHEKTYAHDNARAAIQDYFDRNAIPAKSEAAFVFNLHCATYARPRDRLISIVICTRDHRELLEPCIKSIRSRTAKQSFEIVVVDNGSTQRATLNYLDQIDNAGIARVIRDDRPFNFSALNNAGVAASKGDDICLLNNDTLVVDPAWLAMLQMHLTRPEIGAVGAKLLYPDGTIQHAGVWLRWPEIALHGFAGLRDDDLQYHSRAQLTQRVSAVTGACLATRRDVYEQLGGLNEDLLIAYNDIDFCLRIETKLGLGVIYEPRARLIHLESKSRGSDLSPKKRERLLAEQRKMQAMWEDQLKRDRYRSAHFDADNPHFHLAAPANSRMVDALKSPASE